MRVRRRATLRIDRTRVGHKALGGLNLVEDVIHYGVATFLVVVGSIVLFVSVRDFFGQHDEFAERVTQAVNGVLFVIIVMEILRTVLAHFDDAGLQLKPFLIIGIVSAVRHILTVGAQISLGSHSSNDEFRKTMIELGTNAMVVLVLVVGLILIRRSDHLADDYDE
ncbi:MAG: hypothetical protein QOI99_493 [Actinomycetota bacterium]|nr:hypothetical protein [Actinomycetota bacterium]